MTFSELYAAWKLAHINDAEFIARADEMGKGREARDLVRADLETP